MDDSSSQDFDVTYSSQTNVLHLSWCLQETCQQLVFPVTSCWDRGLTAEYVTRSSPPRSLPAAPAPGTETNLTFSLFFTILAFFIYCKCVSHGYVPTNLINPRHVRTSLSILVNAAKQQSPQNEEDQNRDYYCCHVMTGSLRGDLGRTSRGQHRLSQYILLELFILTFVFFLL